MTLHTQNIVIYLQMRYNKTLGNVIADGLNLKQSLKLLSLSRVHTNSAEKRQIKIQIERGIAQSRENA